MLFLSLITLIMCKALINDKLFIEFYHRISAIILLFSAILTINSIFNIGSLSGIGIYGGLFNISTISQILESFLLIIASLILLSWPNQLEIIKEVRTFVPIVTSGFATVNHPEQILNKENSYLYSLVNSILLKNNNRKNSILPKSINNSEGYSILGTNASSAAAAQHHKNNNILNNSINYSIIVLFSSLGASLLMSCSDLISMYLSIELQSFSLYVLSSLYRDSESSTSAGLKYFLLGGLASCLILFGSGLLYAYTGLTSFESIYSLLSIYYIEVNNNFLNFIYPFFSKEISGSIFLGLIFIFIGFLIKISAAPFHNWSPDVYDDTPTIVTIWLTIIPKISILILLLELYVHIDLIDQLTLFSKLDAFKLNIDEVSKYLLLITSLLSLIIGSVVGLHQNRIKRLLAYSTIGHIGFILLALAIHTKQSIDSFIFYIIQYIITNLNIFLIVIAFGYIINKDINNKNIKDIKYISEFKGQFFSNPLISLSFSICLFSMAGIPPLIGFFSKQYVLFSAIKGGYYFISGIAIFVSVISASYYLKIIKTFFSGEQGSQETSAAHASISLNTTKITETSVPTTAIPFLLRRSRSSVGNQNLTIGKSIPVSECNAVENNTNDIVLSNLHSFLISILTLSILFFILNPSLILNTTQLLSISLFNHY